MPTFHVNPTEIREVSSRRIAPAAADVARAGSQMRVVPIHAGKEMAEVPDIVDATVSAMRVVLEGIAADLESFRAKTAQAADTYQEMEESNTRRAASIEREV